MGQLDKPLSARQLLIILAVLGVIAFLIIGAGNEERTAQSGRCLIHAPVWWDCDAHPTGWPSGR